MTKGEIEEELKRRLDEYSLKHPSTITPKQSDNIFELIEGGTWIWREYAENETIVSFKEEVTKFVARNKAVKLNDVYNHIAQITQKYNERTIRSYVTELCFETDEGFYVYKSCRKAYANIYHFCPQRSQLLEEVVAMLDQNRYYSTSEIEELYEQQYSLIGGRRLIYNICHMHTDFFDTINHGGRNQSQWKLRIPKKEILNRLRRERDDRSNLVLHRTEHMKECRMEAVNTLVYAENNCMPMVDLVKSLLEFMPRGTRKEGIYKIFDEKIFIKDASQGTKKTVVSLNRDVYLKEFKESLVAANKDNDKREAIASNTQSNSADIGIGYSLSFPKDYDAIKEAVLVELSVEFAKIEKDNMGIDFGKAWDRMLQIMNVEHEGSDGVFRRLFTRLYRYLLGHTNPIERFDLYRDLNLDYEAYLRSLLNITTTGLVDVIKSTQQRNLLPSKDDGCSITRYTSWLINHRNDLSHQGGKTKSLAELSRDINQTLVLYLYVAHRVNTIM
jgi:hypothetical protein